MDIQKVVNPKDYEVGVIIARFQVDKLHDQQRKMIDIVCENHKKVLIFLGVSRGVATRRNPMDFSTRKAMVQKLYPNVVILPLQDNRCDKSWSKNLDELINISFPANKALLYGGRDSFMPHYLGKFKTTELTSDYEISGTEIRKEVSREIIESQEFRAGVIYSIYSNYPKVFPTVDVCAYNQEGQILLAKKPNETKWRFIGGFVDATDSDYERAAYREFMEETNACHINNLKYILSAKVDDWRYRKEKDGIMTTLFLGSFGFGKETPSDDIDDLKWFDVSYFTKFDNIKHQIMDEHQYMMVKLVERIYEENLVPNLGEFFQPKTDVVDPDAVVKDTKYQPK